MRHGVIKQGPYGAGIADIAREDEGLTGVGTGGLGRLEGTDPAATEDDLPAGGIEGDGGGPPDAGTRTGDDGGFGGGHELLLGGDTKSPACRLAAGDVGTQGVLGRWFAQNKEVVGRICWCWRIVERAQNRLPQPIDGKGGGDNPASQQLAGNQ